MSNAALRARPIGGLIRFGDIGRHYRWIRTWAISRAGTSSIAAGFASRVKQSPRRDKLFVVLSATFRNEEVIVAAAQALRIAAADAGPGFVYSAAARLGVEKLTDRLEDVVRLMAKHSISIGYFGESLLGPFVRQPEMSRQPSNVRAGYFNSIVAATIGWALRAVEQHTQRAPIVFWFTVFDRAHWFLT